MSAVRETIDQFRALDCEPYGVNETDAKSHQAFIDELKLPFDLLIDEDFQVSSAWGCMYDDRRMNKRTVIIVDKRGKVAYRETGNPPPEDLLEVLAGLDDA